MCPQPWLVGVKRRTLDDVVFQRPSELLDMIKSKSWPYKINKEFYECRDRALISLLYLTCGRISEVLSLSKKQFVFDEEPDFVVIRNMIVVKRKRKAKRKRRSIRDEVPLPRAGLLAPFTQFVVEYLSLLSDQEAKLFRFGRHRAWQIVQFTTGKWCHYFRSQGESWYGKIFSNIFALKDFVGVVDASTLGDYVKTDWKDYRDRILGKRK
jgi:integrase